LVLVKHMVDLMKVAWLG